MNKKNTIAPVISLLKNIPRAFVISSSLFEVIALNKSSVPIITSKTGTATSIRKNTSLVSLGIFCGIPCKLPQYTFAKICNIQSHPIYY